MRSVTEADEPLRELVKRRLGACVRGAAIVATGQMTPIGVDLGGGLADRRKQGHFSPLLPKLLGKLAALYPPKPSRRRS